jgi:hypothetical protein
MFLAFLLHGLSIPAHEFLHGLLFVYGVQLHQLTQKSILHIACIVTLCESFLGIEPHFLLWRLIFRLCPVVSVHPEAQYVKFSMAASVQGWRTTWFYIKDHKASPEDEYGLAPFDASKEVKKLASWDLLPSDAEIEQITPLLSHIQALKGGKGGALSGIQLMVFFVQRRDQPLQHCLTKLWSYSGLEDPARISGDLIQKQDVDKRVRSLTKLTKDHAVAELAAGYFNSMHPLPEVYVCLLLFTYCRISLVLGCVSFASATLLTCLHAGPPISCFTSSSSRRRDCCS